MTNIYNISDIYYHKGRMEDQKLTKILSRRGVCSRRQAEQYIKDGRVKVDGSVTKNVAIRVFPTQEIIVDGKLVAAQEKTTLWLCHKPAKTMVTNHDPQGRKTLFDILPSSLPRVMSVGRLDFMTEGLILLTNSGELARYLELPSTGWLRHYKVRAYGEANAEKLKQFEQGLTVDGVTYRAESVVLERQEKKKYWYDIALKEGKNKEIRLVLEACGLQVSRLIRTSYGPFQVVQLMRGEVKQVPTKFLKEQLGQKGCEICGLYQGSIAEEK
jgi:23S rRNA pseudouridine2605 synthase